MKNITIFASGNGTNAENIIDYFRGHEKVRVTYLFCNNPKAKVIKRVNGKTSVALFSGKNDWKAIFDHPDFDFYPYLIVLAGFTAKIPSWMTRRYKIVNIHPSLLPKHGGKGMYGMNVHKSVIASGDRESGITIHMVNEKYDEGEVVFQKKCPVLEDDTPETLYQRVHELELKWYPKVIESILIKHETTK